MTLLQKQVSALVLVDATQAEPTTAPGVAEFFWRWCQSQAELTNGRNPQGSIAGIEDEGLHQIACPSREVTPKDGMTRVVASFENLEVR